MNFLDLILPAPAENLAHDEALLDLAEAGQGGEMLSFWEPREMFVVVGYANKVASEVNIIACKENKIPIFRRCSGGGTVLQGPGVLNYSLILKIEAGTATASITSANRFIMERNRAALEEELRNRKPEASISINGHTDLTVITHPSSFILEKKFSGNAQRRKKNFLLFHGTFLLNFDLPLVEKFLNMPSLQPDYREGRRHTDFITNLDLPASAVKRALTKAWSANEPLKNFSQAEFSSLARDKYVTNEWNLKF